MLQGIRVGFGYDVHQLAEGNSFVLGGIDIPFDKGTVAHSDGDVLIHAICDALLGAASLGDIGSHFPDTSAEFKGVDSKILLSRVADLLKERSYQINNIDSTISLQRPKLSPFIQQMRESLSSILQIDIDRISIKATTTEKLGFVGNEEGIVAQAVTLISRN